MNKKYALCVGNNYPGTSAELSGCVNDALDWSEFLITQGYEVEMLLEARKVDVVDRLRELVAKAGFGDRVVFTYSGHGTWVWDRNGDEADKRDEALVMADFAQGGLLIDDELEQIWANLRYGASALTLSDSCHSGTVNRFIPSVSTGSDVRPKAKFLSPANFTDLTPEDVAGIEERTAARSVPRKTSSLISGCGDLEYSYDAWFNGRANGAFTYAALRAWTAGVSLNSWHKAIRATLPSDAYPQSPELSATPYRKYTRAI
jgi:hypothetical protein